MQLLFDKLIDFLMILSLPSLLLFSFLKYKDIPLRKNKGNHPSNKKVKKDDI